MRATHAFVIGCGAFLMACGSPDSSKPAGGTGGTGAAAGTGGAGGTGTIPTTGGSAGTGTGGTGGSAGTGGTGGPAGTGGAGGAGGSAGSGGTGAVPPAADAGVPAGDGSAPAAPAMPATPGVHKVFDGTSLDGWTAVPANGWAVMNGFMQSTGAGRGYIATKDDYTHYRVIFTLKPGGTGGHAPTVLIFNRRPPPALDAMGGIQFQPPNGSHWDYRPGKNTAGAGFTKAGGPGPAMGGLNVCEIIANAMTGEAKMACNGKDVLHYKQADAGHVGPFAIQTHNKGITDAYKDITIEEGITDDNYKTVK